MWSAVIHMRKNADAAPWWHKTTDVITNQKFQEIYTRANTSEGYIQRLVEVENDTDCILHMQFEDKRAYSDYWAANENLLRWRANEIAKYASENDHTIEYYFTDGNDKFPMPTE